MAAKLTVDPKWVELVKKHGSIAKAEAAVAEAKKAQAAKIAHQNFIFAREGYTFRQLTNPSMRDSENAPVQIVSCYGEVFSSRKEAWASVVALIEYRKQWNAMFAEG